MERVVVRYKNQTLDMSILEAQKLIKSLRNSVQRAQKVSSEDLRPPAITSTGFLTRDAVYEFFAQIYDKPEMLGNHAGKLISCITQVAVSGRLNLNVVCTLCDCHVSRMCSVTGYSHARRYETHIIEIASLKEHAHAFVSGDFRNVGMEMRQDVETLLNYL